MLISPLISIITINYNNVEGLNRTLHSVVNQTCKEFEYIVIDGGSIDGSKELIEKYSQNIDHWISEPDNGIYNAMNIYYLLIVGMSYLI
jgi:glycosyltransferase involved in cell wall biosynthesis